MTSVSSPSRTDSSDALADTAEFDFSGLPDAETDTPPDTTGSDKICPTCELPIPKPPGHRGRLPKYHPECRPSATKRVADSLSPPRKNNTKASQEADALVVQIRKKLVQGVFFVMLMDQYDGFVMMSAIPGICENIRGVLVSNDKWRKDLMRMSAGGSILGLVFTIIMPVAAICAHHGLIPFARLSEMLVNLPKIIFRVQQRLQEGEKATEEMMTRIGNEYLKQEGNSNGVPSGTIPPTNGHFFEKSTP